MNWKVLLASFLMVFVAELGDKTQLTALAFSASSRSPWSVFLGTSLALITAAALAVVFGGLLARFVPETVLHIGSAVMFVLIGLILLVNVARKAPAKPAPTGTPAAEGTAAMPARGSLVLGLVLSQAREFEEDTARRFTELAAQTADTGARAALLSLAAEERKHAASLATLAGDPAMDQAGAAVDGALPEQEAEPLLAHALAPPALNGVVVSACADALPDTIRAAMRAEEKAAEFYLALARLSSLPGARDAFRRLAMEELRHAQHLCDLAGTTAGPVA